jgi:hypothetical protein
MASGLLEAVQAAVGDRIGATVLPPGVSLLVYQGRATRPPDDTHRPVESTGGRTVGVAAQVASPVRVQATTDVDVTVATAPDARSPFRVRALDEVLDVRLADLHPVPTAVLRLRIDTWVSRVLTALLDQLQQETDRALKENGHS